MFTSWLVVLVPVLTAVLVIVLTLFVNRTWIDVTPGALEIHHGPLPWPGGDRVLPTDRLHQLWVVRKTHRSKNGTRYTYQVHAQTDDGDLKLLSGLPGYEVAHAIERAIEQHLDIADHRMPDEYVG